jgi:hypothetical protein
MVLAAESSGSSGEAIVRPLVPPGGVGESALRLRGVGRSAVAISLRLGPFKPATGRQCLSKTAL